MTVATDQEKAGTDSELSADDQNLPHSGERASPIGRLQNDVDPLQDCIATHFHTGIKRCIGRILAVEP